MATRGNGVSADLAKVLQPEARLEPGKSPWPTKAVKEFSKDGLARISLKFCECGCLIGLNNNCVEIKNEIPPPLPLLKGGISPLWERGVSGDFDNNMFFQSWTPD